MDQPKQALDIMGAVWEMAATTAQAEGERDSFAQLIENSAQHWLALQAGNPIKWEGAIDGAMQAACDEIIRLREQLRISEARYNVLSARTGVAVPCQEGEADPSYIPGLFFQDMPLKDFVSFAVSQHYNNGECRVTSFDGKLRVDIAVVKGAKYEA